MEDAKKEELRRRQAVLEVMKIKFKDTPYKSQPINQERKRTKVEEAIKEIEKNQ